MMKFLLIMKFDKMLNKSIHGKVVIKNKHSNKNIHVL